MKEFQLPESSRTAKQLIPGWVAPRKIVVVVDKPERTAWLQASMPSGDGGRAVEGDGVADALDGFDFALAVDFADEAVGGGFGVVEKFVGAQRVDVFGDHGLGVVAVNGGRRCVGFVEGDEVIRFYEGLGAEMHGAWRRMRVEGPALEAMAVSAA